MKIQVDGFAFDCTALLRTYHSVLLFLDIKKNPARTPGFCAVNDDERQLRMDGAVSGSPLLMKVS